MKCFFFCSYSYLSIGFTLQNRFKMILQLFRHLTIYSRPHNYHLQRCLKTLGLSVHKNIQTTRKQQQRQQQKALKKNETFFMGFFTGAVWVFLTSIVSKTFYT